MGWPSIRGTWISETYVVHLMAYALRRMGNVLISFPPPLSPLWYILFIRSLRLEGAGKPVSVWFMVLVID